MLFSSILFCVALQLFLLVAIVIFAGCRANFRHGFFNGCVCLSRVSFPARPPLLLCLLVVPVFGVVAVFKKRRCAVDLLVVRLFGEFSSSFSWRLSWSLLLSGMSSSHWVFVLFLNVLLEFFNHHSILFCVDCICFSVLFVVDQVPAK